jgi:hypothetical protein
MDGKEWCYDCSAGYCDCECSKCHTSRREPGPKPLYSPPARPRSDSDDEVREVEVQRRIKEAVEAARSEAQRTEADASLERVVHSHGFMSRTVKLKLQALGLIPWGDKPPLAKLSKSISNPKVPVSMRLQNTTASLAKYAEDRAIADEDHNAAWSARVSRKHRISSSSSPEVRRSERPRTKTVRFNPRASLSPEDDSDSYSDAEMQDALQQRGIPTLIARQRFAGGGLNTQKQKKAGARRKLRTRASLDATSPPGFVPPRPRQLSAEQKLPSSREVAAHAAKRTKQLTIYDSYHSPQGPKDTSKRLKYVRE